MDLNKASELYPELVETYYYIGLTYEKMGQKTKAAESYKKYLDKSLPYDAFYLAANQRIKELISELEWLIN